MTENAVRKLIEEQRNSLLKWAKVQFGDGPWLRGFRRGVEHITSDIEAALYRVDEFEDGPVSPSPEPNSATVEHELVEAIAETFSPTRTRQSC